MKIEITEDMRCIAALMEHPDLYDRITDDSCKDLKGDVLVKYLEGKQHALIYLKVLNDAGEPVGFFVGNPDECPDTLEVHISMLKPYRGQFAIDAALKVKELLFTKTHYTRLTTRVPSKYLTVLQFVCKIGYTLDYMIEGAFMKDNKQYDMYCLSMRKV